MVENLAKSCSLFVQNELLQNLKKAILVKMGTPIGWKIVFDTSDPDLQTLLFSYPTKSIINGYIRPVVKIEFGARAEHWPVSEHPIKSYAKEIFPEAIYEPEIYVRVLNAERTFWEKATILHQYAHIPEGKELKPRNSRHYYDFYCLLNSQVKEKALSEMALLENVAKHKSIYFASGWANYGTARKGTLKLSPTPRIEKELKRDYVHMESMLFRDIPAWETIVKAIDTFEKDFNDA